MRHNHKDGQYKKDFLLKNVITAINQNKMSKTYLTRILNIEMS